MAGGYVIIAFEFSSLADASVAVMEGTNKTDSFGFFSKLHSAWVTGKMILCSFTVKDLIGSLQITNTYPIFLSVFHWSGDAISGFEFIGPCISTGGSSAMGRYIVRSNGTYDITAL